MERDFNFQTQIKGPFSLIKIQPREFIESLQSGCIYMNSLAYYREKYAKTGDDTIGDPHEGKLIIHNGALYVPELGIAEQLNDYPLATANENDYVFCMFGINREISDKFLLKRSNRHRLTNHVLCAIIKNT